MGVSHERTLSPGGRGQGEGDTPRQNAAPDLTERARELRQSQTEAERLLWAKLRGRRLGGWKFKRQVPIGPYIADFVCADAWLIIELDGGHHNQKPIAERDRHRTAELSGRSYLVVRFWNHEVMMELDSVCDTILNLAQGAPCHVR
jgi:very-short-patch-repair endonuclease